jgi:hypothetical protein
VGSRGPNANVRSAAPHKNGRPGARARLQECTLNSPKYWDLIVGDGRGWSDPFDPERKAAWRQQSGQIFRRFPIWYRHAGRRPAGFWDFDMAAKLTRALTSGRFTEVEVDAMTDVELVYHLDAGKAERVEILTMLRRQAELFEIREAREALDRIERPAPPNVVKLEGARKQKHVGAL